MHYRTRPFLRGTRFVFRIQRRRSFGSKTTRGDSLQQFREAHRRWERVVLNALAEQIRRCRLIFGPAQCDGNSILRLRRVASSSEKPIHLSWDQRPWRQPITDSSRHSVNVGGPAFAYHCEVRTYGRGGGVGRGRGVGVDLGVMLGVPVGVAMGV